MQEREEMISQLELANEVMWENGICQDWLSRADDRVRKVSSGVNGVLLGQLLLATKHVDSTCAELFREGANPFACLLST